MESGRDMFDEHSLTIPYL